MYLNLDNLE